MTLAQPCMGGWCSHRDHCPHYWSDSRAEPSERLCPPGRDGMVLGEQPVQWIKPSEVQHA